QRRTRTLRQRPVARPAATGTACPPPGRSGDLRAPARYEPFGLSALEAGLAGCALVLGDIPSLREVWGDAALFVPPHDHRSLAATLQRLIGDAELRRHYGTRARARARQFT